MAYGEPEIHTMEECDFLNSIIHCQIIDLCYTRLKRWATYVTFT